MMMNIQSPKILEDNKDKSLKNYLDLKIYFQFQFT